MYLKAMFEFLHKYLGSANIMLSNGTNIPKFHYLPNPINRKSKKWLNVFRKKGSKGGKKHVKQKRSSWCCGKKT